MHVPCNSGNLVKKSLIWWNFVVCYCVIMKRLIMMISNWQAYWSIHKFVHDENFCYFCDSSKYVIFVQKTNFSLKIFMSKLFKIIYMTFMSLRYVTNEKVLSPPTCIKYKLHWAKIFCLFFLNFYYILFI